MPRRERLPHAYIGREEERRAPELPWIFYTFAGGGANGGPPLLAPSRRGITGFTHTGLSITSLHLHPLSARSGSRGTPLDRCGARLLPLEAPCLRAGQQRVPVHAQAARGAALVPVLALQRAQHEGLLESIARLAEGERAGLALSPPRPPPRAGATSFMARSRGRSSSPIPGRVARATLRSMMFSSSRTLPGQS